jgi:DNA-binding CsgD family transcriptional regulator
MATRGNLKSVEFKQAALASASAASVPESLDAIPAARPSPAAVMKSVSGARPITSAAVKSTTGASATSPVAAVATKGAPAPPRFTAEETILLRGLASGASSKEMAAQMRLPRESLYRLIGDLRRKTGATSDTALAVWVLRNMSSAAGERRSGGR